MDEPGKRRRTKRKKVIFGPEVTDEEIARALLGLPKKPASDGTSEDARDRVEEEPQGESKEDPPGEALAPE